MNMLRASLLMFALAVILMMIWFSGCEITAPNSQTTGVTPLGIAYGADAGITPPGPSEIDEIFLTGRRDACLEFEDTCDVSPYGWRIIFRNGCMTIHGKKACAWTWPNERLTEIYIVGWNSGWRWESKNLCLITKGHKPS